MDSIFSNQRFDEDLLILTINCRVDLVDMYETICLNYIVIINRLMNLYELYDAIL